MPFVYASAVSTRTGHPRRAQRRDGRSIPASGELVPGGIKAESQRALRNLGAVLDAAGVSYADVVKTTVFLLDIGDFAPFNAVYADFFPDPPPARSTFAVAALPKGARVEVEAIAVRSGAN